MTTPTDVRCGNDSQRNTCKIHVCNKNIGGKVRFSQTSWTRVCEFAKRWMDLDGTEQRIAVEGRDLFNKGRLTIEIAMPPHTSSTNHIHVIIHNSFIHLLLKE